MKLAVLADDLTGALDTAVKFAAQGIKAVVLPSLGDELPPHAIPDVAAINLDIRHLRPEDAFASVSRAVTMLKKAGNPPIYLKIDSGLRGNIGAALDAVVKATGRGVTFVPAYPSAGRITVGGIHYVDGVPVSQSVFGRDLHNPVRHDAVMDIIALQSALSVRHFPAAPPYDVELCNASTEEDLAHIAHALRARGTCPSLAGCAGFAHYLPDLLGLARCEAIPVPKAAGMLVVSGSTSAVSLRQLERARNAGMPSLLLANPTQKAPDHGAFAQELARLLEEDSVILATAWTEAEISRITQKGLRDGFTTGQIGSSIAQRLAACAAGAMALCGYTGALCVIGGDTLACVLQALAVRQLEPLAELEPGVVVSRMQDRLGSRILITKSGSFGSPDILAKLTGYAVV